MPDKTTSYKRAIIKVASFLPKRFRPFFLHPAGPTTVFFWAPTIKWGLVIANIGDLNRPAETISLAQAASLMLTGAIWSRYSIVITPKNYNLLSVNAFTSCTSTYLFGRGVKYRMEQNK